MRKLALFATALGLGLLGAVAFERDANACGGCFGPPPPPTESPTIVTDHRMILSVAKEQSTLYDQIRYQGSPESFAWVLPISGTVDIGLSADIVFTGLDQMTTTTLQAPPLNCPQRPTNCNSGRGAFDSANAGSAAPEEGGVQVIKKEIVGPYETVQLKADDPQALHKWLADNGFTVPADVKPVIDVYVAEKFNFLALKLVPGKGVQEMRPVRVTTKGASAVLPLRMVAAGTGATVGISLWVVGEGRYEPQNFQSFYINTDELVWDWTSQKSNYVDLRAQKTAAGGGRVWETESSQILYRQNLESYVVNGFAGGNRGGAPFPTTDEERAAQFYLPVKDEQGNVIKTAAQVRDEDMDTLFFGIPTATTRITRMRADLNRAALDVDLVMTASQDQAVLPAFRQITRELNQPQCPVWNGCTQDGTAPRDEAFARSSSSAEETFSCATGASRESYAEGGIGAFLAIALVRKVRERRRQRKGA